MKRRPARTKKQIQKIIDQAVNEGKTITSILREREVMTPNHFYYLKRRYQLVIPQYMLKFTCSKCGAVFERHRAGQQQLQDPLCPACLEREKPEYMQQWRRRHPNYEKNRHRKLLDEGETEENNAIEYYRKKVDGWFYHHDGECYFCHKEKGLNQVSVCETCYKYRSDKLADPNNPYYQEYGHPSEAALIPTSDGFG